MRKEVEKKILSAIKKCSRKKEFRTIREYVYVQKDDLFFSSGFDIFKEGCLDYDVSVKKLSYDEIFWNIMDMQDNCMAPISLRANGAFVSPSMRIEDIELKFDYDCDPDEFASIVVDSIEKSIELFLKTTRDFNHFVLEGVGPSIYKYRVLYILACIDKGDIVSAREMAKKIEDARPGIDGKDFVNEGKGFYQRVLEKYY